MWTVAVLQSALLSHLFYFTVRFGVCRYWSRDAPHAMSEKYARALQVSSRCQKNLTVPMLRRLPEVKVFFWRHIPPFL